MVELTFLGALVLCASGLLTAKEVKVLGAATITVPSDSCIPNTSNVSVSDSNIYEERPVEPAKPLYAPDEILVKFRRETADKVDEGLRMEMPPEQISLGDSLDKVRNQFRVNRMEPVFRDFKQIQILNKRLEESNIKQLKDTELRLLKRQKRAPKNSRVPELDRIYKIKVEALNNQPLEQVVKAFNRSPDVEYAELNYTVTIDLQPNDTDFSIQWPLQKINAQQAWDINTGSNSVIVAVVDTGVDYNHRDISDNMWTDANGYHGRDYVNSDNYPLDDHGHGTHCAGIIAAKGNNGKDIAGVCWNAKIMALKFLDSSGSGSTSNAVTAFYYAVNHGADIISNSWGTYDFSQTLQDAINYAYSQGVIIVAAAGNEGQYYYPHYPSSMEHVISVASTDSSDHKASSSNYGTLVNISAPGVNVLSLRAAGTSMGTPYDAYTTYASGTSMACPHVSGLLALMLSEYPVLSRDEILARLFDNADDISAANPAYAGRLGSGRINAYKSLRFNSEATVKFNRTIYSCNDVVEIQIHDFDISGTGTQHLTLTTTNGDSETVTLTEDANQPWIFNGTISTTGSAVSQNDGLLEVSDGEIITAAYTDLNFGDSGPHIVQNTANIDCVPPNISHIAVHNVTSSGAMVRFQTNEPATARIRYGQNCNNLCNIISEGNTPNQKHDIYLPGLISQTYYYFAIDVNDIAGNLSTDDNGGQCHSLTTSAPPFGLHVPADYATIQAAVNAAPIGGTIWLSDGTYTGPGNRAITYSGKAVTVRSENGPNDCIIDCENISRAFTFDSGENANAVVEGITIRNGYAGGSSWEDQCGGAIHCYSSSPTISNCVFMNNHAVSYGGAILLGEYAYPSNSVIDNCTFLNNSAQFGGGIFNNKGNQLITNCTFTGNLATYDSGGGICCWQDSYATIENCQFKNNASWLNNRGGAIGCLLAYPLIKNCLFIDNFAMGSAYGGGGIYANHTHANIENCTFYGNTTTTNGGACQFLGNANIYVSNCILFNNYPNQIYQSMTGGTVYVSYSDVQSGYSGTGNINTDPRFVTGPLGDYYLSQTASGQATNSLCVNAGSDTAANLGMDTGTTRTDGIGDAGIVDLGYHYSCTPVIGPDLNKDAFVDFIDYAIFANNWLQTPDPYDPGNGDITNDGQVDIYDLFELASSWLNCYVLPAANTNPADHAIDINRHVTLAWSPGVKSTSHDVYFGTDFNGVDRADRTVPNVYMGNQDVAYWDTNNYDQNGLDLNTTYYWRIDEVAGCMAKGNVWSFTTARTEPDPNLVARWKFDEGTGAIAYDSAGTNNGAIYGAAWTTGKIGGALSFNGTSNYVDCGSAPSNYDNITVSAWMQTSTNGVLVSNRDNGGSYGTWYTLSSTNIEIGDNSQGGYRSVTFNTPTLNSLWHQIVYTKNGTSHAIYVDGSLDQQFTSNADISQNSPLFIGIRWTRSNGPGWFNGIIDDVRIYNRALSAEEIAQLYGQ